MPSSGSRARAHAAKFGGQCAKRIWPTVGNRSARMEAFDEGAKAQELGVLASANPYPLGTERSKFWSRGYRFAAGA